MLTDPELLPWHRIRVEGPKFLRDGISRTNGSFGALLSTRPAECNDMDKITRISPNHNFNSLWSLS